MWEEIWEALRESLIALPILLLVYLLIEYLEHKKEVKFENLVAKSKKTGPLLGGAIGIIPQCAFSSIMSDLFSKKLITIGTLFAVFLATSDEAIAIMLSSGQGLKVFPLILSKFIISVVVGYLIDIIFKNQKVSFLKINHTTPHLEEHEQKLEEHKKHSTKNLMVTKEDHCADKEHNSLHHHHEICSDKKCHRSAVDGVFKHAFLHAIKIFIYILVANVVISLIIHFAGGVQSLVKLFGKNAWYTPILTSLIGLIPNCAASVVLMELYLDGIITFASCLAGLCAGSGVGLLILFKRNKNLKQNLLITLSLYFISVIIGFTLNLLPFLNF